MRPAIFVDTAAFVGAWVAADQHHERAVGFFKVLQKARRPLLMSTDVFDESVTLIKKWGSHEDAVAFGKAALESNLARLVEVNAARRARAWELHLDYEDRSLSMTDCTTIAVMKEYGIDDIFTFDMEFKKVGLAIFP